VAQQAAIAKKANGSRTILPASVTPTRSELYDGPGLPGIGVL